MASGVEVVQGLIQLGTIIKGVASKSGTKDSKTVLTGIGTDPSVSKAVFDLYDMIKGNKSLDAALSAIRSKESAILEKANVPDATKLGGQALLDYHSLADAELALATQKLIKALDAKLLDWLVNEALPALTVVLPLLLSL